MASESAEFKGTEGQYLLPHHVAEIDRLRRQHQHFAAASDNVFLGFHLSPSTDHPLRILDSGCADGTWLRDIASQYPEHSFLLHGVDIASHLFPNTVDLDLRQHDIRQPFPDAWGWTGSFDIIHQRLLVWALKKDEWPQVVRNLQSLLKPGGTLQLVECQWLFPERWASYPEEYQLGLTQIWATEGAGMDIRLADKLEPLLKESGFDNVTTVRYPLPYGAKVKNPADRDISAELWVESFRHLARRMGDEGIPGVAKTPEEYHAFLDRLVGWMKEKGYEPEIRMVCGQKTWLS
ncbi:S-adenosyl-L-methionine-dependent methyltransferase [Aspergillus leporis]|uniref:S-adenosyl-L-methionine-dependent methyltransferase n=1 Tax=Aspergillus leporis TaxID=41062 RepID=A0A5N5XCN8_9EURO|nr:S-adenosyl-L-methionine-dependent methyltransferase [Aspergillus leporis]